MVNVAGRSKGCLKCRQRRIGCGQEKPQCTQCIRLGHQCPGYTQERLFVHVEKSSFTKSAKKLSSGDGRRQVRKNHRPPDGSVTIRSATVFDDTWSLIRYRTSDHMSLGPLHRQQLFQEFLSSYLPKDHRPSSPAPWFTMYSFLAESTTALDVSLMALCTASLGRERKDPYLIALGVQFYTTGIQRLQRALWNVNEMRRDQTLGAASALALYEVIECPGQSRSSYLSHQKGLARLIELRGPHAYSSPLSHGIFASFRTLEALDALEQHSLTFLTDPSWLEQPWANFPKTYSEQVMDIILSIPALLKEADEAFRRPVDTHAKATSDLILNYWNLDARLDSISETFESAHSGLLYWPQLSTLTSPADDPIHGKVFPVSFGFPDVTTATTLMLHWTAKAMVNASLALSYNYIQTDLPGLRDSPNTLKTLPTLPEDCRDWGQFARNACQCTEYLIGEEVSGYAKLYVTVPLTILVRYLESDSRYPRELEWVRGTLEQLSHEGVRVLRYRSGRPSV